MLGKASEIKTEHISTSIERFENHLESWKNDHPSVDIVDIKISAVFVPGTGERVHALIIYKEAKEDE